METDNDEKELEKMVLSGINRMGVLYNKERIEYPEKYSFTYQNDYYMFQHKITIDNGFYRYIFSTATKSNNFLSTREFVIKTVLIDLCYGKFNTTQVSGEPYLESFHRKNKSGNYTPRHARRKLNEEFKNLAIPIDHIDSDERKKGYKTAFRLKSEEISRDEQLKIPNEMWGNEVNNLLAISKSSSEMTQSILLKEIFPERWIDLKKMQKTMLETLSSLDEEIKNSNYFKLLYLEIKKFSPIFIILSNHVNSICEINWFMKKKEGKRKILLENSYKSEITSSDIIETMLIMKECDLKSSEIITIMRPVVGALLFYKYNDAAEKLSKTLLEMCDNDKLKSEILIEYSVVLRDTKKYKEMLNVLNSGSNFEGPVNLFTITLIKIRHAEALFFNGNDEMAVRELEEIFNERNKFVGSYTPYNKLRDNVIEYVLREKFPVNYTMPFRVSILINLIYASSRIENYCLKKKYLEELLYNEQGYFQDPESNEEFIKFHSIYNETIFLCDKLK